MVTKIEYISHDYPSNNRADNQSDNKNNKVNRQNFDSFYFSSERYTKYPELLDEDKLKYRNQRLRFNGSTDIPWQVIPIWQENLPSEFTDSNFNNFISNLIDFVLKYIEIY